ncbi:MAG: anthranilate phosphoribosyltransferase [Anaerolineaceae bacterium]|nr:anthranilate phosphoribosyltransferase [Anaerolineaceae bacterium]MDE0329932.1 anthranilate phosphoribosyltransferase [Anaerolineaceae bacterium]
MDILQAIEGLVAGRDLQADEAEVVMNQIMAGEASDAQIGGYLTALRIKGETRDEIVGSARAMRANATQVPTGLGGAELLDTCGTGGDGSGTFNISTTVAFVAAGAGVKVAKHGNRAASSLSGSADVLAALGVNLDLSPEQVGHCIDEVGIGFLYAIHLHPAMKHAIGPRRELKLRTIFNILGPLTNPAGARRQLMGVFAPELTETLAEVLGALGALSAIVVNGAGGLDELGTTGPNRISHWREGRVTTYSLDAAKFGLERTELAQLKGGDASHNAAILRAVLDGSERGPKRDIVLLNAGAALLAAGSVADMGQGIELARETMDSGAALAKLDALIAASQAFAA